MTLEVLTFILGPIDNNTYLIAETESGEAAVIDPSFGVGPVTQAIQARNWHLGAIWLTHAHFDHIAGTQELINTFGPGLQVTLHPQDLDLWRQGGGAANFGISFHAGSEPNTRLTHGQQLQLGAETVEVRHTPGHTRGHVALYAPSAGVMFSGDLIFRASVGRTDLPGGDFAALLESIRTQVLTLPPETRLLSGHGPETTVAEEALHNPFLG